MSCVVRLKDIATEFRGTIQFITFVDYAIFCALHCVVPWMYEFLKRVIYSALDLLFFTLLNFEVLCMDTLCSLDFFIYCCFVNIMVKPKSNKNKNFNKITVFAYRAYKYIRNYTQY